MPYLNNLFNDARYIYDQHHPEGPAILLQVTNLNTHIVEPALSGPQATGQVQAHGLIFFDPSGGATGGPAFLGTLYGKYQNQTYTDTLNIWEESAAVHHCRISLSSYKNDEFDLDPLAEPALGPVDGQATMVAFNGTPGIVHMSIFGKPYWFGFNDYRVIPPALEAAIQAVESKRRK